MKGLVGKPIQLRHRNRRTLLGAVIATGALLATGCSATSTTESASPNATSTGAVPSKVTSTITAGKAPTDVAFSPDGSSAMVANSWSGTVSVIDVGANSVSETITVTPAIKVEDGGKSANGVCNVVYAPDGNRAFVAHSKGSISVIDTATNKVQSIIDTPGMRCGGLAITPDGETLYSGDLNDGTISVIDGKTEKLTKTFKAGKGAPISDIALSPDGANLYVPDLKFTDTTNGESPSAETSLNIVDTATNIVTKRVPTEPALGIAISPDGATIYLSSATAESKASPSTSHLTVMDAATTTVTATIPMTSSQGFLTISPDGRTIYSIGHDKDPKVSVVETSTKTILTTFAAGDSPWMAAVSPDGQTVYVTSNGVKKPTADQNATESELIEDTVYVVTNG